MAGNAWANPLGDSLIVRGGHVLRPLLYAGANASTTVPFISVRASFFLSVRSFSDTPSPTRRHQPSTTASCSAAS